MVTQEELDDIVLYLVQGNNARDLALLYWEALDEHGKNMLRKEIRQADAMVSGEPDA
jgi:uncharacterized ferredoxin-like protein